MPATPISDAELALVAAVAGREGWTDLSSPPEQHPPRSLSEELAVARFRAAVPTRRAARSARAARIRARMAMVVLAVLVLGACWYVSPARTAIGLIGAGLFSLVALRRSRRREAAGPRPRRWSISGPVRAR